MLTDYVDTVGIMAGICPESEQQGPSDMETLGEPARSRTTGPNAVNGTTDGTTDGTRQLPPALVLAADAADSAMARNELTR